MKIRLIGQVNILGGGKHYQEFFDALNKFFYIAQQISKIDIFNEVEIEKAISESSHEDINIWFIPNVIHMSKIKGVHVVWAIFESNKLPKYYADLLAELADLVWVPSKWGKTILTKNGINPEKIDVVPEGVNSSKFHPFLRRNKYKSGPPFRFLMHGKFEERKGYHQLFEGFKNTFNNSSDVVLLIKADYFINHAYKKLELEELLNSYNLRNVKTFWGAWDDDLICALYNHADAFIFPSRAEGWGLPLIESLATGLPTTSTYYSGHTEFLEPIKNSFLKITHTLEEITDAEFKKFWPYEDGNCGEWANPNIESISTNLAELYSNYDHFYNLSITNSDLIRNQFDWSKSVGIALKSLKTRGYLNIDLSVID